MNKKLTINYIKDQIIKMHPRSELISTEYINAFEKLDIKCENGHFIKIRWNDIQQEHWCPKCAGNEKKTINHIHEQIIKMYPRSELISTKYINAFEKLNIKCEIGHFFEMCWHDISKEKWCPVCGGTKKKTITYICNQIIKMYPRSELISTEYINNSKKLNIKCEKGHSFKTCWSSIQQGQWCPKCSNNFSSPHENISNFLNDNNIIHENNKRINPYEVDILISDKNLIIEINGNYWHANPKIYSPDYYNKKSKKTAQEIWGIEEKRNIYLKSKGYEILILWEDEINNNFNEVEEKLLKYINL